MFDAFKRLLEIKETRFFKDQRDLDLLEKIKEATSDVLEVTTYVNQAIPVTYKSGSYKDFVQTLDFHKVKEFQVGDSPYEVYLIRSNYVGSDKESKLRNDILNHLNMIIAINVSTWELITVSNCSNASFAFVSKVGFGINDSDHTTMTGLWKKGANNFNVYQELLDKVLKLTESNTDIPKRSKVRCFKEAIQIIYTIKDEYGNKA